MRLRGLLLGLFLACLGGAPAFASIPAGDFWSVTLENTTGSDTLEQSYSVPDGKHLVLSGGQLVNGTPVVTTTIQSATGTYTEPSGWTYAGNGFDTFKGTVSGTLTKVIGGTVRVVDFGTERPVNGFDIFGSPEGGYTYEHYTGGAWVTSVEGAFAPVMVSKVRITSLADPCCAWNTGNATWTFTNVVGEQFAGIKNVDSGDYVPLFNSTDDIIRNADLHFKGPTELNLYATNFTRAHFYGYLADYNVCTIENGGGSSPAPSSDPSATPTTTPAPDASASPDPDATTYVGGLDADQARGLLYQVDKLLGVVALAMIGVFALRFVGRFW